MKSHRRESRTVTSTAKAGTSKFSAELRRKLFVEAYLANGGNATEAAKSAGYSSKTAYSQGARLLKDVEVSAALSARARELARKYELNTEMVIRSIVQELTFDPARLYHPDGTLKKICELDEDTRMALTAIEMEQIGSPEAPVFVRKVKWPARAAAREHAMKHLGLFAQDNRQKRDPIGALFDDAFAGMTPAEMIELRNFLNQAKEVQNDRRVPRSARPSRGAIH